MKKIQNQNQMSKNKQITSKLDYTYNKHLVQIYFCPCLARIGESSIRQLLWMINRDLHIFPTVTNVKWWHAAMEYSSSMPKGCLWIELDEKKKMNYKIEINR